MTATNALYLLIEDRIQRDELKLPGLPETAERIRTATSNPDTNLQELAAIIQHDTALSARLIRLANSAYLSGRARAESLMQALTRIGLRRIRTLVVAMAVEQVFDPKNDIVKQYAQKFLTESRDIAAAAVIVTQHLHDRGYCNRLHQDVSLLAGMVCRIGVAPILKIADEFDDSFANPSFMTQTITHFDRSLGVSVLEHWRFAPNLIKVPYFYNRGRFEDLNDPLVVNYCDIVHIASLLTGHSKPIDGAMTLAEYQQREIIPVHNFWEDDATQKRFQELRASLS
ncbi:HD-like signal output (HDOD) protein [Idiomarina fontislapidosi]|uniref:Histidine kinase n=1 Tax=Idiomarina fontislapidosi TaxID=263723 RepID=A0A432Y8F8_9GAMM|nr:HDOD domain-containing protein [Idiomarina fontislapidosi]PYE33871.1 HD-like signal output (HDOD) protein [Idiomarina fontislapidosi]RUO57259.1 histidine kinase [Idiomarina fontislapidosi]